MGSSSSYHTQPQELNEFRRLQTESREFAIPELPENRSRTDQKWLLALIIVIISLLPFLIYTLIYSDIRRLFHSTDNCGNICGYENTAVAGVSCTGQDFSNKPYVEYTKNQQYVQPEEEPYQEKECVESCPEDYKKSGYDCYPQVVDEISSFLDRARFKRDTDLSSGDSVIVEGLVDFSSMSSWKFIISSLITLALSIGLMFLYRYATAGVVWGVLIFTTAICVILTAVLWYAYSIVEEEKKNHQLLFAAIILTCFTLVIIVLLVALYKKIRLVILLYKEATKAIFSIPTLMLVPVLTLIAQAIILALFVVTEIYMVTSGTFQEIASNMYDYVSNGVMSFTLIFNIIVALWITQFIIGCQYMTIAGGVATWYFSRNKQNLSSPVWISFKTAIRFHLGTLACGSLVITITTVIKILIRLLIKNEKLKICVEYCMQRIETLIKFLSKNAYIETAIHGQSFFPSGKRAANLLLTNIASVIAVNYVGDFVLGMAQLILLVITTGLSYTLFMDTPLVWLCTILCGIINLIIITITFAVFETTVDTLFICFCEDKTMNDGISKPYYMSKNLMEFVDNAKKVYNKD